MLWFYTRDQQSLTLETRYDNAAHEYVAILTGLGGPPITKRFPSAEAFQAWIAEIETDLAAGHWVANGPPHILPDGWRDKPWSL